MEHKECKVCKLTFPDNFDYFVKVYKTGNTAGTCKSCKNEKNKAARVSKPYVYRFINEVGELVYIGKTFNLKLRMANHFKYKTVPWKSEFKGRIEIAEMQNTADMNIMEQYLISIWKPSHNKLDNYGDMTTFKLPVPDFKLYKEI